jgi:hypothetical protein
MSRKMKNSQAHISIGGDIIGNSNNLVNKQNKQNSVDKSNNVKTVNNYNISDDITSNKTKYESIDRLGIYHKVDKIITCEVIVTDQTRVVKSTNKEYVVCINVLENGKLIADHIHVDFGEYGIPDSRRVSITGKVYAYGPDNDKRGIALIEEPIELPDSYITNSYSCFNYPKSIDIQIADETWKDIVLMNNKELNELIQKLRKELNYHTSSRLGFDTVFNYIATQVTLNSNNKLIYDNKLQNFDQIILITLAMMLALTLYDLSKIIDDERYIRDERHGYNEKFSEINIMNIFRDIAIKCNSIQGYNYTCVINKEVPEQFKNTCELLAINPGKAFAHVVKHRYDNFGITENDEKLFNKQHALIVLSTFKR